MGGKRKRGGATSAPIAPALHSDAHSIPPAEAIDAQNSHNNSDGSFNVLNENLLSFLIPSLETLVNDVEGALMILKDEHRRRLRSGPSSRPPAWEIIKALLAQFRLVTEYFQTAEVDVIGIDLSDDLIDKLDRVSKACAELEAPVPEAEAEQEISSAIGTSPVQGDPEETWDQLMRDESPIRDDPEPPDQRQPLLATAEVPTTVGADEAPAEPPAETQTEPQASDNPFEHDDAIAQFALQAHMELSQQHRNNLFAALPQMQAQTQTQAQPPVPRAPPAPAPTAKMRPPPPPSTATPAQSRTAPYTQPSTGRPPTSLTTTIPSTTPSVETSTVSAYEAALTAAAAQTASSKPPPTANSKNQGRTSWTSPEVHALMTGLDRVQGPYWSQILSMYGAQGTVSTVLARRSQVQLKDKARNLKMLFLKLGREVPLYLRGVTGELEKRAPARATKEGRRRALRVGVDVEEERGRMAAVGILSDVGLGVGVSMGNGGDANDGFESGSERQREGVDEELEGLMMENG